ncbi:MAG: hypothetical protein OXG74_15345, partial [Acidobacteria bacterium]|nr:hypothetical protein [Acidobacteriota bacterium]
MKQAGKRKPPEKRDESGPRAKLSLVALLLVAGFSSGVLTPETIRTSAVAMAYLAGLVLMVASVVIALGRTWGSSKAPGEPEARPEPAWHVYRTFTDPLFQGPAAFCVFVLVLDLVADLAAEPPQSAAGVWLLWTVATASVLVLLLAISRPQQSWGRTSRNYPPLSARSEHGAEQPFVDPWFSIPGGIAMLVVLLGEAVELVEEYPSSAFPWLFV